MNKGIDHFTQFIETYRNNRNEFEEMDEDDLEPFLLAHIYIARAHQMLITSDFETINRNLNKSLGLYKFVAKYATKVPKGSKLQVEVQMCEEMVNLMPKTTSGLYL